MEEALVVVEAAQQQVRRIAEDLLTRENDPLFILAQRIFDQGWRMIEGQNNLVQVRDENGTITVYALWNKLHPDSLFQQQEYEGLADADGWNQICLYLIDLTYEEEE